MLIKGANISEICAFGAGAMSGTINATALSQGVNYENPNWTPSVVITDTSHGIKADSDLFFADIDAGAGTYFSNKMRHAFAVATNTMTLAAPEGYTAGTPAGSEVWCAGWTQDTNFWFWGFKLHLNAADASGETLTLTLDSKRSSYLDTLIYSKVMTGVTDIIYMPSDGPIPFVGGDILKFAWTNTGAKTWGVVTLVSDRG